MAQARAEWWTDPEAGVGGIAPKRLVFLDECGVLTNMARLHGRSPRGERAHASVPCGTWKRVSVLGAIGSAGMIAALSLDAATDSASFAAYLEQVLLPELQTVKPDAVLVLDNLRPHKTAEVQAVLEGSGFAYRYLPPYSPDLSQIEPAWAKFKAELREVGARRVDALHAAIGPALGGITAQDAAGFFRHCGYNRLE